MRTPMFFAHALLAAFTVFELPLVYIRRKSFPTGNSQGYLLRSTLIKIPDQYPSPCLEISVKAFFISALGNSAESFLMTNAFSAANFIPILS